MQTNKKGQQVNLTNLAVIVMLFVVAVLVLTFTSDIVSDIGADQTANSAAKNVSTKGEAGLVNVADQFGNIGTVIGAALIIAILLGAFAFYKSRQ